MATARIYSGYVDGVTGRVVPVVAVARQGALRSALRVELLGAVQDEATKIAQKEIAWRVSDAAVAVGFPFSDRWDADVTIGDAAAPAPRRGSTSAFDLAVALALVAAMAAERGDARLAQRTARAFAAGSLLQSGGVVSTRGILPLALAARTARLAPVFVPWSNACEGAVGAPRTVWPVESLQAALAALRGTAVQPTAACTLPRPAAPQRTFVDLRALRRNEVPPTRFSGPLAYNADIIPRLRAAFAAKRSVLLLDNVPTDTHMANATMLAHRIGVILPPLTRREQIEVATIQSAVGLLSGDWAGSSSPTRPFRAPYHSTSIQGLAGSGSPHFPGETSLAHRGVLLLTDADEFSLQSLNAIATVHRAKQSLGMPADFFLVGSLKMNPDALRDEGGFGPGLRRLAKAGLVFDEFIPLMTPEQQAWAWLRRQAATGSV